MKQNIYDDPQFFSGYKALRDTRSGLNEVLEQPALYGLLPGLEGSAALDLGCGAGHLCSQLLSLGARRVVGVDISQNMLEQARESCAGRVELCNLPMEDYDAEAGSFDLVISSLAFHYVSDLAALSRKIHSWLKPHGCLLFSMEHPICTCSQGIVPGWARDAEGKKLYWCVDQYSYEGRRESRWFIDGVLKYHRTVSSVLNCLIDADFSIARVLEPHAIETAEADRPSLLEERRRPPFLIVKAVRQ